MEANGFGDTPSCRKCNGALEKKTPYQGVARPAPSVPALSAGTEPTRHSKVLRDFHPLSDILSSGLSRNVSLETISSCLRGGFSARKPLSWALGNPRAVGQGAVIQRLQVAGGTADVRAGGRRAGRARGCVPRERRAHSPRPSAAPPARRQRHRRGGNSACLILPHA